MAFSLFRRRRAQLNGAAPTAPTPTSAASTVAVALPALIKARKESAACPPNADGRPTLNRLPRRRDDMGNVLSRSAWVDPALPPMEVPIENTDVDRVRAILIQQGREPTARWLGFLYNQQVLQSVKTARERTIEGYDRLQRWNEQALRQNAQIDLVLEELITQKEEALAACEETLQNYRRRADRAHRRAAKQASLAGVEYTSQSPHGAVQEFAKRALRAASASEKMAECGGIESEARYVLDNLPFEPQVVRAAPTRRDESLTEKILTAVTIVFGAATFVSLATATGIAPIGKSGHLGVKEYLIGLVIGLACIGAAKALSLALNWCGELIGAAWFRGRKVSALPWLGATAAALGLLTLWIDASIHRTGLLKSAMVKAANDHTTLSAADQGIYWLMALFLVVGYVACSLGVGMMQGWRESEFEIASQQYTTYAHEERQQELHGAIAKARQEQAIAAGIRESAPEHTALLDQPLFQTLLRACNRATVMEERITRAEGELAATAERFDAQIEAVESTRKELRETLFEEDRLLVEEAVHIAHWEIMVFRSHLYHTVHQAELPWLLRWVRRWLWLWEPRSTRAGRV